MTQPHVSRSERLVRWAIRRRWMILVIALLAGVAGSWRTTLTYAHLRSDLEELLPRHAPSVAAIETLRSRLDGLRYLGIVIDTGGSERLADANRFVDDLVTRIATYPGDTAGLVRKDVRAEREFLEQRALQLMDPGDVRTLREAVERRRDWEVTRALDIDLLDEEDDPRPEIPIAKLRAKYEARHGRPLKFPDDRFISEDGHTVVLVVRASAHGSGQEGDQALLGRVEQDIRALDFPAAYGGGMRVGYAGDVATRLEELKGLYQDLAVSGFLVMFLVLAVLRGYFGSWRALPILGVPLLLGTVYTFGLVALPPLSIRHLNTNTAFLGSVVVGNGINSGIILLARFAEERRRGTDLEPSIVTAIRTTWRPTLAAAVAASTAYGSLVFTDFRGFTQFGWIGGVGMITCWTSTYVLAPTLLHWLGLNMADAGTRRRPVPWLQRALGAVLARPGWVIGFTAAATLAASIGLYRRGDNWLEYDYSKLRRRDSYESGERYWGRRMDATLRTYLTPTVIMTRGAKETADIARRVRGLAADGKAGALIGSVRTAAAILPEHRSEALVEARKLRTALTPKLRAELDADDRKLVESALSDAALTPLLEKDVPDVLVAGFRERGGRLDRTVLVYPKLTEGGTWDGPRIKTFTEDLRAAARAGDPSAQVAGPIPLSSDITSSMKEDGPLATALGLGAALVICALAFGSIRLSIAAILSLLVGVWLMMGGLAWTDAKLNFANFVVLPITFGISADYAINVLRRYQAEGNMTARQAVASTGGAVAMCSATTIIGFGSLLAAKSQALFSFGVFAVAGEVTMLATAALSLPAVLALRERAAAAPVGEQHQDTAS